MPPPPNPTYPYGVLLNSNLELKGLSLSRSTCNLMFPTFLFLFLDTRFGVLAYHTCLLVDCEHRRFIGLSPSIATIACIGLVYARLVNEINTV